MLRDKFLIAMLFLACVLLFARLDDVYLWGDEATTALLAKNILTYGYPRVWDGRNLICLFYKDKEFNSEYVWIWQPWLAECLAALSFGLFKANTFTARLPFALLGLLTVPMLYALAQELFSHRSVARWAVFLLATSVSFLLHARQCRYYALVVFATVWALWSYWRALRGHRRAAVHLTLALIALFHSNYLNFFGVIAGMLAHYLLCGPTLTHHRRWLLLSLLVTLAATLPWFLYAGLPPGDTVAWRHYVQNVRFYLVKLNLFAFPFVLAIPLCLALRRETRAALLRDDALSGVGLLALVAAATALVATWPRAPHLRYVISLVPVGCLLAALALAWAGRVHAWLAGGLAALLVASNLLSAPAMPLFRRGFLPRSYLWDYVSQITHSYEDDLEVVAKFLKRNGHRNQTIYIEDPAFPIVFYTGMKVIDSRWRENQAKLAAADWVFSRAPFSLVRQHMLRLEALGVASAYDRFEVVIPDTPRGASRPDPEVHQFRTAETASPLVIYRKKTAPPPLPQRRTGQSR